MALVRTIAARFSRLLNSPWTSEQDATWTNEQVGRHGENIATRWLRLHGCRVLYRNFRAPGGGEVDITCRHDNVLCFVEVKCRTNEAFGRPAMAVTPEKQALIVKGANEWLRMLGWPDIAWRFDIIEVMLSVGAKPEVNWINAAFSTEEMRRVLAQKRRRRD